MLGDNMLEKFSVKNYKKFKDEIEIDFANTHEYQFNEKCIKDGIITKSIMFGKNSSGKSSFGYALFDIVMILTDKHITPEQNLFCKNMDSSDNYIEFKYTFRFNGKNVKYNYKKDANNILKYEEFFIQDVKVFSYDFTNKKYENNRLDLIDAENLNFNHYEGNIAILRYIANNTSQSENSIVNQLVGFVSGMLWFRSLRDNAFIGLETNSLDYLQWIINNNKLKKLEYFLKDMAGINVEFETLKMPGSPLLLEKHPNGNLPFMQVASSGTIALTLLFYWQQNIEKTSFVFIDEFDAFYHFELSKKVIELFFEYEDLQVMFTSHNTYLVSNELLRPDCYYILENGKIKSFADITKRELREGHNIEKMLRQGEFNE